MKPWRGALLASLVLAVGAAAHALAFLALGWYPGTDNYSYDVAGLQLLTGIVFDRFPLIYRPPLAPVVKNVLYLLFEGHPYCLNILLHATGFLTLWAFLRLGRRFSPLAGLLAALIVALDLDMAAIFHIIDSTTVAIPLLVWNAAVFARWIRHPGQRPPLALVLSTALCALTRPELLILAPVYAGAGWLASKRWQPAALLLAGVLLCQAAGTGLVPGGSQGSKTGWSLFIRLSRKSDAQFDLARGPATSQLYDMMARWSPVHADPRVLERAHMLNASPEDPDPALAPLYQFPLLERQMYTLNTAQEQLDFLRADALFRQAAFEAVRAAPGRYLAFSLLRLLCNLGLWNDPGLSDRDCWREQVSYLCRTAGKIPNPRDPGDARLADDWTMPENFPGSPFDRERDALQAWVRGRAPEAPPESWRLRPNYVWENGAYRRLSGGRGPMSERISLATDLDAYFLDQYWGPRFEKAYIVRARRLMEDMKLGQAEPLLESAVDLAPANAAAAFLHGVSLEALGREAEAREEFARASARIRPERWSSFALLRALAARERGRPDEAVEWLQRGLAQNPDDLGLMLPLGSVLLDQGHPDQAEAVLKEAAARHPETSVPERELAAFERNTGRPEEARRRLEAIPANRADEETYVELALTLEELGRAQEALELLERTAENFPSGARSRLELGILLRGQGKPAAAFKVLQSAVRRFPDRMQAYLELAGAQTDQGDAAGAERTLQMAVARFPLDASPIKALAVLERDQGRLAQAERDFETALTLDGSDEIRIEWAIARRLAGQAGEACETFKDLLLRHPSWPRPYVELALCQRDGGRLEEARLLLEEALARSGGDPDIAAELALTFQQLGNLPEAERIFKDRVRAFPQDTPAWLRLAAFLKDCDRTREARTVLADVLRREPDNERARLDWADLEHRGTDVDRMLARWEPPPRTAAPEAAGQQSSPRDAPGDDPEALDGGTDDDAVPEEAAPGDPRARYEALAVLEPVERVLASRGWMDRWNRAVCDPARRLAAPLGWAALLLWLLAACKSPERWQRLTLGAWLAVFFAGALEQALLGNAPGEWFHPALLPLRCLGAVCGLFCFFPARPARGPDSRRAPAVRCRPVYGLRGARRKPRFRTRRFISLPAMRRLV